jgi:hypothetical protein
MRGQRSLSPDSHNTKVTMLYLSWFDVWINKSYKICVTHTVPGMDGSGTKIISKDIVLYAWAPPPNS